MKISIRGGGKGKGWSNYVTRKYVKLSKYERSKITMLRGNTKLGDSIIKSSNYKDNSTTLVLSFKGKVSDEKARAVNEDFKELFMTGFDESEYHYEAVLHQDTANTHIHIRIPTKNLLTDTQLRLYYHDKHKNFINAIRDYLILKHDLPQPKQEHKPVFSVDSKKERLIQEQRAKEGRKSFDFTKKKGRDEAKSYIANYIAELHESGLIEDFEDLKEVIKGIDLDIVKIGKDITGDFYYFTVQDKESGKKIRLQGEIYNAEFWEHSREDRAKQIRANRIPSRASDGVRTSFEEAEQRLKREVSKRKEEVRKRYESSRRRSRDKHAQDDIVKNGINSDNKPIFGGYRGSDVDENSTKKATRYDTKRPKRVRDLHQREVINDSIRARTNQAKRRAYKEARQARIKLYEADTAEPRDVREQIDRDYGLLYRQAKEIVRTKRQRRANRRRNIAGIKQIVGKVGEFRAEADRRWQDNIQKSSDIIRKFERLERKIDGLIAKKEPKNEFGREQSFDDYDDYDDDYSEGMGIGM